MDEVHNHTSTAHVPNRLATWRHAPNSFVNKMASLLKTQPHHGSKNGATSRTQLFRRCKQQRTAATVLLQVNRNESSIRNTEAAELHD